MNTNPNTHTTEEEKLVKMFLTLLDFTNRFTVSILRMFWWELVHHMTNNSILKWGPTSWIGSSSGHHVMNKVFNVLCPNWRACWGWLTSSYGVSDTLIPEVVCILKFWTLFWEPFYFNTDLITLLPSLTQKDTLISDLSLSLKKYPFLSLLGHTC